MDHSACMVSITALGGCVVSMAGGFWKILLWWKKESEGRLKDSQELSKIVGDGDETRIQ